MSFRFAAAWLAAAALLVGCAAPPLTPVELRAEALSKPGTRIGVAMSTLPKPDTYFPGASCLLCIAVASGVNSAMTTQVRTFGTEELATLREDLVRVLKARGLDPVVIEQPINIAQLPEGSKEAGRARRNFAGFRDQYNIDRLLVVQIDALGVTRGYAAYVPTGDPRATVDGAGYIVDLATQSLDWYLPLKVAVPASDNKWDEPPTFPGITNAYFQALEQAKDELKAPLAK